MSANPTKEELRARHQSMTQLAVSHESRRHSREWYQKLREDVTEGGKPYVLTGVLAPHEIFEALDLHHVVDGWYSGLTSARGQGGYYSSIMEQHGYHSGLPRYFALHLGVLLDEKGEDKPWGGLPPPSLVVALPQDRASEVIAERYSIPIVQLSPPTMSTVFPSWWTMSRYQWEMLDGSDRIDLVVEQLKAIVAECEKLAGKKLDLDRLREIVRMVNTQEEYFDDVRTLIATAPKTPARLGEITSQVMAIQWHRGTQWAVDQARAFRDEIKQMIEAGVAVCESERRRLMFIGPFLWRNLEFFADCEDKHGAVFVRSNYLSIASDGYLRYGERDPLRALASRYATFSEQMHVPGQGSAWAEWEAREHRVDGAVALDVESMRGSLWWWGQKLIVNDLREAGIPVVEIPADPNGMVPWDGPGITRLMDDFLNEMRPVRGDR